MEVILLKSIRKLGKVGEVVKVKNGFSRNYLIPRQLAVFATKSNKQLVEQQKAELEQKNTEARLIAEETAKVVSNAELVFIRHAAVDGRLFGSVTSKEIAHRLTHITGQDIPYSSIILSNTIKSLGVFTVAVILHAEVTVNVLIVIARTEPEATEYLLTHKNKG